MSTQSSAPDPAARNDFVAFVRAHQSALFGFAVALTGDRSVAEELTADVVGDAYANWARISRAQFPLAYVRRMVLNKFLRNTRRRTVVQVPRDPDLVTTVADREPAGDSAQRVAEHDALAQRLASLPKQQQAALALRYYLDLSDDAIADELGCKPASVRGYISRGLATLRIDDGEPGSGPGSPAATVLSAVPGLAAGPPADPV